MWNINILQKRIAYLEAKNKKLEEMIKQIEQTFEMKLKQIEQTALILETKIKHIDQIAKTALGKISNHAPNFIDTNNPTITF